MVKDLECKLLGKGTSFKISEDITTVVDLRARIATEFNFDVATIRLSHKGRRLEDGNSLDEYGCQPDTVVYVMQQQAVVKPEVKKEDNPAVVAPSESPAGAPPGLNFADLLGRSGDINPASLGSMGEMMNNPIIREAMQQMMENPEVIRGYMERLQNDAVANQMFQSFGLPPMNSDELINSLRQAGAGQPQQSEENVETKYAEQIETLNQMGFVDKNANIRALVLAEGDITKAANLLIADDEN